MSILWRYSCYFSIFNLASIGQDEWVGKCYFPTLAAVVWLDYFGRARLRSCYLLLRTVSLPHIVFIQPVFLTLHNRRENGWQLLLRHLVTTIITIETRLWIVCASRDFWILKYILWRSYPWMHRFIVVSMTVPLSIVVIVTTPGRAKTAQKQCMMTHNSGCFCYSSLHLRTNI